MKTNYKSDDELIFSLPDYITGRDLEKNIREQIEERLKVDNLFYAEYIKIMDTYEYMKGVETDKAPDNYFSSLLPKINERIESNRMQKSLWHYIIGSWKIAVPALTVILLIMIFNKSDKIEHINVVPEFKEQALMLPADSNGKNSNEVINNIGSKVSESTENTNRETVTAPVKQKNVKVSNEENTAVLNESLFGETEEEDEFYYEDEFHNLNENEQNELINNLKNTKF
jgi:hypothetical protein